MEDKLKELERRIEKLENKEKARKTMNIIAIVISTIIAIGVIVLILYYFKNITDIMGGIL